MIAYKINLKAIYIFSYNLTKSSLHSLTYGKLYKVKGVENTGNENIEHN